MCVCLRTIDWLRRSYTFLKRSRPTYFGFKYFVRLVCIYAATIYEISRERVLIVDAFAKKKNIGSDKLTQFRSGR